MSIFTNNLDFQPIIVNAIRVNAEKGNAPGYPGQFRYNPATLSHSLTKESININSEPGPGIPIIGVKPPWSFDGMIPDVAFTNITDSRQETNLKMWGIGLLLIGMIMVFGPK